MCTQECARMPCFHSPKLKTIGWSSSGRMDRGALGVYSGALHSSEGGPGDVTADATRCKGSPLQRVHCVVIPFVECSQQARGFQVSGAGEQLLWEKRVPVRRRMPRGFWETSIIVILSEGRDYTDVFHVQ